MTQSHCCGVGRPGARPHDLRYTAATVAIASGAGVKGAQKLLSHAAGRYAHQILSIYYSGPRNMEECMRVPDLFS